MTTAHEPITPSPSARGTSGCGPYGDYLHDMDQSVGRILEALERNKLTQNTLVIFTSDNGGVVQTSGPSSEARAYAAGLRVSGPWRGRKHSVYEGGFRVPFLARWPGKIPANTVCDEPICLVDLMATVAAAAKTPLPVGAAGDSFNVLPALLGAGTPRRPLRPHLIGHSANGVFAIREGPWKWIEGKPHGDKRPPARAAEFRPQLYNLQSDPAEEKNLLAEQPVIAQRLAALLDECRTQTSTRRPERGV